MKNKATSSIGASVMSYFYVIAFGSLLAMHPSANAEWEMNESKDAITGKFTFLAMSEWVNSADPMRFPYEGTRAVLILGCGVGYNNDMIIVLNKVPKIRNVGIHTGYNVSDMLVNIDGVSYTEGFAHKWRSKSLRFVNKNLFIPRIKAGNHLSLEVKWRGIGNVYFNFSLRGATKAIASMERKCT